jgi:hypothetical protein
VVVLSGFVYVHKPTDSGHLSRHSLMTKMEMVRKTLDFCSGLTCLIALQDFITIEIDVYNNIGYDIFYLRNFNRD